MGKTYVANEIGFSGCRWPQHRVEVDCFVSALQEAGSKSYLEIGCLNGDTVHYVAKRLPVGSTIVAVDKPRSHEMYADAPDNLIRAIGDLRDNGYNAHVIFGDSHSDYTLRKVQAFSHFDAILIDGDHSKEGVELDWLDYGPMGNIVGFHDAHKMSNVKTVYDRLAATHKHHLCLLDDKIGIGIGIIFRT